MRSHGGPTGRASPALNLQIQFWTSRGFAVVDVDYAGSTGYGRAYRSLLEGRWGIADVEDCIAAARYLAATGRADPERLAIRGGSAGGYTTLCALTFHDCFKAGRPGTASATWKRCCATPTSSRAAISTAWSAPGPRPPPPIAPARRSTMPTG